MYLFVEYLTTSIAPNYMASNGWMITQ
jgi:hypothetical protein